MRLFPPVWTQSILWTFVMFSGTSADFERPERVCTTAFKFDIPAETCRRKISILYTKHYESPFEKLRARKNDIVITKFSRNNSN